VQAEPAFEVIGECGSGTEAIAAIKRDSPDLVFLDMQMPGCDGLRVLAELPEDKHPAIIFATAHERFALDAFDVAAVDYLLKPFDRERCAQALRRAQSVIHQRSAAVPAPAPEAKADRITVKADGRLVFLQPEEIVRVEAADNYVMLHLTNSRLMLRETMTAIETRLGSLGFARVNRSAIVNLDMIREIHPAQHGDYTVVLRDGTKLPLSRSLRGQLDKFAGG
jgi:two-component system LytT family response regulator